MVMYEIIKSNLPNIAPADIEEKIIRPIEAMAEHLGMVVSVRTTLSTKRGSVHWHMSHATDKGVLEITYWPKQHQLWLEIHKNRQRAWNLALIAPYADALAAHFGGQAVAHG